MDEIIRQIRVAAQAGLYYLALFGSLSLPDICGALASPDGRATASKYKAWLREYVPEQAYDADLIYGLRCSLLHQGSAMPDRGSIPIAFVMPSAGQGALQRVPIEMASGESAMFYNIPDFVGEITHGAESWLRQFEKTNTVLRNLEKFARLRPEGLPPMVVGCPVVA